MARTNLMRSLIQLAQQQIQCEQHQC